MTTDAQAEEWAAERGYVSGTKDHRECVTTFRGGYATGQRDRLTRAVEKVEGLRQKAALDLKEARAIGYPNQREGAGRVDGLQDALDALSAINEECPERDDRTHCVHWWDGEPCCSCGAPEMTRAAKIEAGMEHGPMTREQDRLEQQRAEATR